jgi:hypothetical protein
VLEALDAEIHRQYAQDNKDLTEVLKPGVLRLGTSAADVVTRLINKSNVKGFTPLMLACSGGHTDVVAWLIKHGASWAASCLHYATSFKKLQIAILSSSLAGSDELPICSSGIVELIECAGMYLQVLMSGSMSASGATPPCTVQQKWVPQMPSACCWHAPALSNTQGTTGRKWGVHFAFRPHHCWGLAQMLVFVGSL